MPLNDRALAGVDAHVHVFDASAPVRPGHYRPVDHPLAEIESIAAARGLGPLVLVQPSVYGSDNRVMLRALQVEPGRHRGVAVVEPDVADAELDRLHAAGVRGVRFNLVSPAGHAGDLAADLFGLAPRLRERGWHLQWYVRADQLPQLAAWQARSGLVFVLDHLAGLDLAAPQAAWDAAAALADGGAWIKLSGWYRLGAAAPYDALLPHIARAASMFGPRTVWGSDWPHTGVPVERLPDYATLLDPLRKAIGEDRLHAVLHEQAHSLYF